MNRKKTLRLGVNFPTLLKMKFLQILFGKSTKMYNAIVPWYRKTMAYYAADD